MRKTNPKTIEKYKTMLQNPKHVWTKNEINALGKLITSSRWDETREAKVSKLNLLLEFSVISNVRRSITKEQSNMGKDFLKQKLFTSKNKLRASKVAKQFGPYRAEIVRKLKKFTFDGYHALRSDFDYSLQGLVPVYTAYDSKGNCFSYAWVHWGPVFIDSEIDFA